MAPTPKKKHTRSRSNKRVAGKRKTLHLAHLAKCPSCGKLKFSHTTCANCGYTHQTK